MSNAWEERARAAKVAKILATVPSAKTPAELAIILDWLRGLKPEQRALVARAAGTNLPSDETWRQVIEKLTKQGEQHP
jgi:hypothetical protein